MKLTMLAKGIILIAAVLVIIYLGVFFTPDSSTNLSLDPKKFFAGDYWRLLTYQFAHANTMHLATNTIALIIAAFLAVELKTILSGFYITYLVSGLVAVLPLWWVVPFIALGASSAVYSSFGVASIEANKLGIKPYIPIALFIPFIIGKSTYQFITCSGNCVAEKASFLQGSAHLMGFVFGIGFFLLLLQTMKFLSRKKYRCLRASGGY